MNKLSKLTLLFATAFFSLQSAAQENPLESFSRSWYSLESIWTRILDFLPRLLLAIVILFVGWLIAKLIRSAAIRLLKTIRVHEAAEKAGIEAFLSKGGVGFTMISLLGQIVYWFIIFISLLFAVDVLQLQAVQQLLNPIVTFIPNIFVAVMLLIFGMLLARIVQSALSAYLRNIGIPNAEMVGTVAHYLILVFVLFVVLEQLHIGGTLLVSAFQLAFGGLALAFGLAFGLGGKDVAKSISERIYKHFQ